MNKKGAFSQLSTNEKIGFVWDYYRWHILVATVLCVVLVNAVYSHLTYKAPIMNVSIINATLNNDGYNFEEYLDENGFNTQEDSVFVDTNLVLTGKFDTSYTSLQTLHAYTLSGSVDIFVWTDDMVCQYFVKGISIDLSEVFSEEILSHGRTEIECSEGNDSEEPYPCMIKINNCKWAQENLGRDYCYVALSCNPTNLDNATRFVDFLLSYN